MMDNTARGILAEFLVAMALRQLVGTQPRVEWDAYDFLAHIRGRKVSIEVKSSSKIQSWKQQRYSPLQFRIAPTHKSDRESGRRSDQPLRADVYVFCAFAATNADTHTVALNADHWRFRVGPGTELPDQDTITWNRLGDYGKFPECDYSHLGSEVEAVVDRVARKRIRSSTVPRQPIGK